MPGSFANNWTKRKKEKKKDLTEISEIPILKIFQNWKELIKVKEEWLGIRDIPINGHKVN